MGGLMAATESVFPTHRVTQSALSFVCSVPVS